MAAVRRNPTEICGTCWYAGGTAGYRRVGKTRKPQILCHRRYELHDADDSCPKYLNENRGRGQRDAETD